MCVCVFFTLNRSSTRRHPAHPVSVLILHPIVPGIRLFISQYIAGTRYYLFLVFWCFRKCFVDVASEWEHIERGSTLFHVEK